MKTNNNTETTVGIFLLFGIGVVCTLILFFGEVKDYFEPSYNVTVTFADASGLLKGSDVYLSGAVIGKVTSDPEPVPDEERVVVHLKINSKVKIRGDAKLTVGSSGLLGDRFVDVQPHAYKPGTDPHTMAAYVKEGDEIHGAPSVDLGTLAEGVQPLLGRANDIAVQLDDMITRFNTEVLPATSTADLKETISKLRETVDNSDAMVKNANELLEQAKNGKGVLGRLINDKKMADNLATFIANIKAHGVVFYHDDSADTDGKKNK